jgi:tetratricopeptide (TPR) repeat protein
MKYRNYSVWLVVILLLFAGSTEISAQRSTMQIGLNRIEGRVTDEVNNGVYNAYVELYDNYGSLLSRQRSTGQGRFSFRGMGPGRYTISVKPYGTNLAEDEREIEINNQSSRSDTVMVDFRLRQDKRFQHNDIGIVGTVFAQEVPPEAKRLYKSGIEGIQSRPDKALAELGEAIKLFPTYFDALAALGKAYVIKGKYADGYPYLLRAIDVNRRCSDCYYSLSLAFYKINELVAATKAIDAAAILQPKSPAVRLLQGMIYRLNNDLTGAEKALLMAKSLFNPPNSEVHWQLSLVYNRLKRNQEAADELEQYLKTKSELSTDEKENVRNMIAKLRKAT